MTDRTHSEDAEHEVVEEALHVVTTLRDMGRGENIRSSLGGACGGQQRTHSQSSATDIDSNEHDDCGLAEYSMCTPRELRKVGNGRGCKTGGGWLTGTPAHTIIRSSH